MKIVYNILFLLIGISALAFAGVAFIVPSSVALRLLGMEIPPWAAAVAVALVTLSPSFARVAVDSPLVTMISNIVSVYRSKNNTKDGGI